VLTVDSTSITVSGLDLAADGGYWLDISLQAAGASGGNVSLNLNGDTTTANYRSQYLTAYGTGISGARNTDNLSIPLSASGFSDVDCRLKLARDGRAVATFLIAQRESASIADIFIRHIVTAWTTVANVTSVTFTFSVASGLKAGSFVKVYKVGSAAATSSSTATGTSLTESVFQVAHGFVVGNTVSLGASGWVAADTDTELTMCDGIVSTVTDASNFIVTRLGRTTLSTAQWDARTGDSSGLIAGDYYWLSSTAGGLTKTAPTSGITQVVGRAESPTVMWTQIGPSFAADGAAAAAIVGSVIGRARAVSSADFRWVQGVDSAIPADASIPQISEGKAWSALDLTYVVKQATSKLRLTLHIPITSFQTGGNPAIFAFFRDSTADAIWGQYGPYAPGNSGWTQTTTIFEIDATTVGSTTISLRVSAGTGTTYFNTIMGNATNYFGGPAQYPTIFTIEEIKQ
jgi:hypothetical protein